ncbi:MAG: hypothetical protein LBT19_00080 [Candidatus Nomurabacteria bacterium]|jgi:hypothetical protein|nr:hypothetical protein [Candidatus Nomurabacteria bacterium]
MNPENLNNTESQEREHAHEENLKFIEDSPAIPLLLKMNIAPIDIYSMDENTLNDLRKRLEDQLTNPTTNEASSNDNGETPPANDTAGNSDEGPALIPPIPIATSESEKPPESEAGDKTNEEATGETPEPATEQTDNKPEKKKFWTRNKRIGAAVLAVIASVGIIAGTAVLLKSNEAGATENPPGYEQMDTENSHEFKIFEGTDYRDLFLNSEGDDYNEAKQGYLLNPNTGQWEQEASWKYDISPRVLDDLKIENDELGARATILNQLSREPEFLAIVANRLGAEDKARLGLDGISTVAGMESALENEDTLNHAELEMKDLFENNAIGEFTTFTGNATNYYMRAINESNIQNDASSIEAARTATRYYDSVDVFIIHMADGSDIIFDIDCLNVIVPVEPGTPEDEVEPGTPIITEETPENPDTGAETGTETGAETGNESGTGDESGGTGTETGTETGNENGTGIETGTETGNEGGTELTPKNPQDIEDNMQVGDESNNFVTPLPAGEETERPDTSTDTYNPETNKFEDSNSEVERPAETIVSEDGSGSTVAEIIDQADQTHAEDVNLSAEDQAASEAQQEANESEITNTPELSNEEAGDWFEREFGG